MNLHLSDSLKVNTKPCCCVTYPSLSSNIKYHSKKGVGKNLFQRIESNEPNSPITSLTNWKIIWVQTQRYYFCLEVFDTWGVEFEVLLIYLCPERVISMGVLLFARSSGTDQLFCVFQVRFHRKLAFVANLVVWPLISQLKWPNSDTSPFFSQK